MNPAYEPLFTPFSIRNTRIKNRYFMAAMGTVTHNDEDGAYLPDAVDYFVRRAAGGAADEIVHGVRQVGAILIVVRDGAHGGHEVAVFNARIADRKRCKQRFVCGVHVVSSFSGSGCVSNCAAHSGDSCPQATASCASAQRKRGCAMRIMAQMRVSSG